MSRVEFSNFDINVSQQNQYSEKAPTTVGCIRICAHFFHEFLSLFCGHHEDQIIDDLLVFALEADL